MRPSQITRIKTTVSNLLVCATIYLIFQKLYPKKTNSSYYTTPYDETAVPFTDLNASASLYESNFWKSHKASYTCPSYLLSRVGKVQGDGGKWMCGLDTFARYTVVDDYACTFYSFGVNEDSAFEAEVLQRTLCSVYAYDPTVDKIGPPLTPIDSRVHFQKMGIGGGNRDNGKMEMKTLKTFMDENGHGFIDILKIDVDGYEYESIEAMLKDFDDLPFGQLLIELHNTLWTPEKVQGVIELVSNLEKRGARVFSVEPNVMDSRWSVMIRFGDETGHNFIDILKIAVEGTEYDSDKRMLKDFDHLPVVGQLLVEFHIFSASTPERVSRIIGLVGKLENRGARVFPFSRMPFTFISFLSSFHSLILIIVRYGFQIVDEVFFKEVK